MKTDPRLLPAATSCRCQGCEGLGARYGSDPDLLSFYRRRLLQRSWGGSVDDVEREYQRAHVPWFAAAEKSGLRLAQGMGRRERFAVDGEATDAKAEEFATMGPSQLPMALAVP